MVFTMLWVSVTVIFFVLREFVKNLKEPKNSFDFELHDKYCN